MTDLWTVGHSNRSLEEFLGLLDAHGILVLVDVRTVPRSRHNPQFNVDRLPGALASRGIGHRHEPGLGGLRKPRPDSPNAGWRNESFRGYADHLQTGEFEGALDHDVLLDQPRPQDLDRAARSEFAENLPVLAHVEYCRSVN